MSITHKTGAIILAAGGSKGMGMPKQLLKLGGTTLIRRAVNVALEAANTPIVVVLGANATVVEKELEGLPIHVVVNEKWESGIGTSIQKGLEAAMLTEHIDSAIFTQIDQPFADANFISILTQLFHQTDKLLLASRYNNNFGAPYIVNRLFFRQLYKLKPAEGLEVLFANNHDQVLDVPFPRGERSIDTIEDYNLLVEQFG